MSVEAEFGELCKRCGCCSVDWVDCYDCEDGYSHHDCGEDCCCCLHPEPNVVCDICDGKGGWYECIGRCDKDGKHEKKADDDR